MSLEYLVLPDVRHLTERQLEHLKSMRVDIIPTGTVFPIEKIVDGLPKVNGFSLLEAGCGTGSKTIAIAQLAHDRSLQGEIHAIDINNEALNTLSALADDIGDSLVQIKTDWEDVVNLEIRMPVYDAICAFGLFCNLVGEQAEKTTSIFAQLLKENGRLYLADCLRIDDELGALILEDIFGSSWQELLEEWRFRYEQNHSLGLPDGTFLVFASEYKDNEFSPKDVLKECWKDKTVFERYARHWRLEELFGLFTDQGLVLEWNNLIGIKSRTGDDLLGVNAIFKKGL